MLEVFPSLFKEFTGWIILLYFNIKAENSESEKFDIDLQKSLVFADDPSPTFSWIEIETQYASNFSDKVGSVISNYLVKNFLLIWAELIKVETSSTAKTSHGHY